MNKARDVKAKVFISCDQKENTEEALIVTEIEKRLAEKGYEPYVAMPQLSYKGLKENIYEELASAEYFLFIDFKREKLEEVSTHRGSLFCHQQLAIASFLDMHILAFQEIGVKDDDGLSKFLRTNRTPFTDRHTLVNVIADKIEQAGWKPDWKNQISMEVSADQFSDVKQPSGQKARFFQIAVKNLNPYKHARNCHGFLEEVKKLSTGQYMPVECIEFKWAGYTEPHATILPSKCRYLDGFYVYHEVPYILHFNLFSDSSRHFAKILGPGEFELTYLVISDNFKPVRSKFKVYLARTLEEIKFEKINIR